MACGRRLVLSVVSHQIHIQARRLIMGSIHLPPLSNLAEALIPYCGLVEYVETGTYLGDSLVWAASRFSRVTSIEVREDYMRHATARLTQFSNVSILLGDSGTTLAKVVPSLSGPSLFWLDAHSGAGFFGADERCPLLQELEAVATSTLGHCLIIDDARAFLAPPPPPFDYRKWPSLEQIMSIVLRMSDVHVAVIEDALIAVPSSARTVLAEFCAFVRPRI
jgi:hypothetical protein